MPVAGAAAAGLDDGVSSGSCHQLGRSPASGSGGVATDFSFALMRGKTVYGPIADPFPSSAHASEHRATFGDQGGLCANRHDVNLDLDGDARIRPVKDLVLQTTHAEYDAYRQTARAPKTCAECHMPALSGGRRAADGVAGAPDPQAAAREALLASAATLALSTAHLLFRALPPCFVHALLAGHTLSAATLSGLETDAMVRAEVAL